MKKSKLLVFGIALFSMMMIFSSCAKYPQTEIDVAKTAISETKDLGADVYPITSLKIISNDIE